MPVASWNSQGLTFLVYYMWQHKKMMLIVYTILLTAVLEITTAEPNSTMSPEFVTSDGTVSKILSRRKRFLIFPDGSSAQLVFCTQNHGYLQIGNIVWFGNTAALAWELPTDPEVYDMFRDKYKVYEANRRNDVIYYVDEEGKVVDRKEYRRKIIINPAFAKRSVDIENKNTIIKKLTIKRMHAMQKNINFLEELDATRTALHWKERQKLYAKLEKFLQALGWNGKECILRMLCLTAKTDKAMQGNFVEEILRAIFTLPKVQVLSEVRNQYDDAHGANGDCAHLYPNCKHYPII